jgi:GNAT superfamily N-acetyltransferase
MTLITSAAMKAAPALVAHPARTATDAEALRAIRNTCAPWMTGDNREIAAEQQAAWWASDARGRNAIWLFAPPHGPPVGFGLIRMEDGQWWATLGLLPEWRGRGHGVAIYRHLIAHCPGDLWIRVLLTNPGSARAAEKAGFRPVDSNGVYAEMVARWRP